jgi:hypothetical protein
MFAIELPITLDSVVDSIHIHSLLLDSPTIMRFRHASFYCGFDAFQRNPGCDSSDDGL